MGKQYGSKKKRRRAEYLKREEVRKAEREHQQERTDKLKNAVTIGEMADAMEIPLH